MIKEHLLQTKVAVILKSWRDYVRHVKEEKNRESRRDLMYGKVMDWLAKRKKGGRV